MTRIDPNRNVNDPSSRPRAGGPVIPCLPGDSAGPSRQEPNHSKLMAGRIFGLTGLGRFLIIPAASGSIGGLYLRRARTLVDSFLSMLFAQNDLREVVSERRGLAVRLIRTAETAAYDRYKKKKGWEGWAIARLSTAGSPESVVHRAPSCAGAVSRFPVSVMTLGGR